MKVYLVQQLRWVFNDEFFDKDYDKPVKAFLAYEDAEAYRKEREVLVRRSETSDWKFHGVPELFPHEDPNFTKNFYEIIEAEIS